MLNSIKTLKRYWKAALNVFKKKAFGDNNKILFKGRFFESNRLLLLNMLKLLKIKSFFYWFLLNFFFRLFSLYSQTLGFSRFRGLLATL